MSTDVLLSDIAAKRDLTEVEARGLVDSIRVDIEDVGVRIATAYLGRAWVALDYQSWDAMCTAEFDGARLRVPREQRVEQVQSLRSAGLSTRAIGAALGIDKSTVRRDLPAAPDGARGADAPREPVVGQDGKAYPATQPARARMPERVPADTTTGEVTDPGDVPFEQWQEQQDHAALTQSVETQFGDSDARFCHNLSRAVVNTRTSLLALSPERAIEVCRDDDNRRADLLGFLGRVRAWTNTVESGLGRNLRSVR